MFHKSITALALVATAALSACTVPTDPNALPGQTAVSPAQAAGWFQQVCGNNRNNARGALSVISGNDFVLNSTVGRYYHRTLDLSFVTSEVSAGRSYCEMGWRNGASLDANRSAVGGTVPGTDVQYNPTNNFYSAVLISAL